MGLEIVEQVPDLDAVIVPVGGAGLLAGVSLAVKTLRPEAKIVAVEAENVASFSAALEAGKPAKIALRPTLADGLAIPQVGSNAFEIAKFACRSCHHCYRRTDSPGDPASCRIGKKCC